MMNTSRTLFTIAILSLLLAGCNDRQAAEQVSLDVAEDTSPVLATVNGEKITQGDVDFMITRTFSGSERLLSDNVLRAKVLDSLIASTAMKQKVEESLEGDKLVDIKNRAKAYEDELYVKEYLVQHATPQPVSSNMVQDYYNRYPEEFGGGESRQFEMLSTDGEPTESERDSILAAAVKVQGEKNWAQFAQATDLGLKYKKSTMQPNLFPAALESAVNAGKLGESTGVVFVRDVPHFIRVLGIQALPAKPISEVSAKIRKKLAALQLKAAVKSASQEAISQATVVRN